MLAAVWRSFATLRLVRGVSNISPRKRRYGSLAWYSGLAAGMAMPATPAASIGHALAVSLVTA